MFQIFHDKVLRKKWLFLDDKLLLTLLLLLFEKDFLFFKEQF